MLVTNQLRSGWYNTNTFYLDISVSNLLAYPTLHPTNSTTGLLYQLWTQPEVSKPNWAAGQIITNTAGTNQIAFNPVSVKGQATFFRATQGSSPGPSPVKAPS